MRPVIILLWFCLCPALYAQDKSVLRNREAIETKDKNIYYEHQKMGYFKNPISDTALNDIAVSWVIYNNAKNRVAEAAHFYTDSTWSIITPVDQKKEQVPYKDRNDLRDIIYYLLLKNYL